MSEQLYILFCESPFEKNRVDEDFEDEFASAQENGFGTLLFSFEDLTNDDRFSSATRQIISSDQLVRVIYRGWMLTPDQYAVLYHDLLSKNYQLINTVEEYQNCHYLPNSLKFIEARTPKTVFEKFDSENSLDKLIQKSKVFGKNPIILKDYVKSEKHDWEGACFVRDASNEDDLRQKISKLIELRGSYLNEGIVVREFIELNDLTIHSKSGMPLTEEYRLFFCNGKLIGTYDYWEEGEYKLDKPNTVEFEQLAAQIQSHFFSMDIARQKNGTFIIIELGDGQVAGLPDKTDRSKFYSELKNAELNS
ncbi:ATP-grasp domain-containing protein [Fluviicola sp.]|uniref:ATP-grasp domain-containing protein n=1 Tax=Fluviicola sp. TaxID=1917219 RepID=UPI0031DB71D3